MTLLTNSMYSAEQEEFWALFAEHIEIQEAKRQAGAVYDYELIERARDNSQRLAEFWRRNRGKTFRVFRSEDIRALVRDDLPALDDAFPLPRRPSRTPS